MRVRGRVRFLGAVAVAAGLVVSGLVGDGFAATRTADAESLKPVRRGVERAPATDPVTTGRSGAAEAPGGKARGAAAPQPVGVEQAVDAVLGYAGERTHTFRFPGAKYVKLHFARLAALPGDRVTVADPSGTEIHSYRVDRLGKLVGDLPISYDESGGFWATSVSGDTAVVSLESVAPRPATGLMTRYGVVIDKLTRGFTPREAPRDEPPAGPGSEESTCGGDDTEDAVCYKSDYPVEYARSRPVARLLINGSSLCTAWRIGPDNRMLTNNHCLRDAAAVRNTEVWFDYQCTACGDRRVNRPTKVTGAELLAADRKLDFALFTVSDFTKIRDFGYLTLDNRQADEREEVYIPQHPGGDPKQLALDSDVDGGACQIEDTSYPGYAEGTDASYFCDTAPGSSGSPVISRDTHQVIALHHFGGCPNSGVRADLIYAAIGDQL